MKTVVLRVGQRENWKAVHSVASMAAKMVVLLVDLMVVPLDYYWVDQLAAYSVVLLVEWFRTRTS